jgi:transposase
MKPGVYVPGVTSAVIDTQSVKTATTVPLNQQGPDPGKKVVGRKRGIVTDVLGLILAVAITAANVSDNAHAATLLTQAKTAHPSISAAFADQGFKDKAVERAARAGIQLVITSKPTAPTPGFTPARKRWVVERSFGTLMFARRLVRDYEKQASNSKAMIYPAQTAMLTKRLTGQNTPTWRGC